MGRPPALAGAQRPDTHTARHSLPRSGGKAGPPARPRYRVSPPSAQPPPPPPLPLAPLASLGMLPSCRPWLRLGLCALLGCVARSQIGCIHPTNCSLRCAPRAVSGLHMTGTERENATGGANDSIAFSYASAGGSGDDSCEPSMYEVRAVNFRTGAPAGWSSLVQIDGRSTVGTDVELRLPAYGPGGLRDCEDVIFEVRLLHGGRSTDHWPRHGFVVALSLGCHVCDVEDGSCAVTEVRYCDLEGPTDQALLEWSMGRMVDEDMPEGNEIKVSLDRSSRFRRPLIECRRRHLTCRPANLASCQLATSSTV